MLQEQARGIRIFGPSETEADVARSIVTIRRTTGSETSEADHRLLWSLFSRYALLLGEAGADPWFIGIPEKVSADSAPFCCLPLREYRTHFETCHWAEFSALYVLHREDKRLRPRIESLAGFYSLNITVGSVSEPREFWWLRDLYQTAEGRRVIADAARTTFFGSNFYSLDTLLLQRGHVLTETLQGLKECADSLGIAAEIYPWGRYADFHG